MKINLNESQLLHPARVLHVRDNVEQEWKLREIIAINHHEQYPFYDIHGKMWWAAKHLSDISENNLKPIKQDAVKVAQLKNENYVGKTNDDYEEAMRPRRVSVSPLVIADIQERIEIGTKEYGEPLTTHNGRNSLQDVYEEILDAALYVKQELLEREARENEIKHPTVYDNVRQWARDRGLLESKNANRQFLKVAEELGELASAMNKDDYEQKVDGLGDVAVTLIILANQLGLTFETCLEEAWEEIKDRQGVTIDGVFIKDSDVRK